MTKRVESRKVIVENLLRLMQHHWGGRNVSRLGREAKIGQGGAQRILAGEGVNADIMDGAARCFNLKTWQLLVPNLDPRQPPRLALSNEERQSIERLRSAAREVTRLGTETDEFPALTE